MVTNAPMKNGTDVKVQYNTRIPPRLRNDVIAEIKRQGRKRDFIVARIYEHFLSLKPSERERICSPQLKAA